MPHSTSVVGCQPKPMVLRNPRANTERLAPSKLARKSVACSGFVSAQASQLLPTEM